MEKFEVKEPVAVSKSDPPPHAAPLVKATSRSIAPNGALSTTSAVAVRRPVMAVLEIKGGKMIWGVWAGKGRVNTMN